MPGGRLFAICRFPSPKQEVQTSTTTTISSRWSLTMATRDASPSLTSDFCLQTTRSTVSTYRTKAALTRTIVPLSLLPHLNGKQWGKKKIQWPPVQQRGQLFTRSSFWGVRLASVAGKHKVGLVFSLGALGHACFYSQDSCLCGCHKNRFCPPTKHVLRSH